jgi:hypothetical protein
MREVHIKPDSTPVFLFNYLSEPFTFYWDKEAYTLEAGEKQKMFRWLAVHGAVKMAERWFSLNPTNATAQDPKQRGFYSRHDDIFKDKVKEAIIDTGHKPSGLSETAHAVESMNQEPELKTGKKEIELKAADDEIVEGCKECRATGPRHKPTCSLFKKHEKDEAQAAKLAEAAARNRA